MKISLEQVIAGALLKFGMVDDFVTQYIVERLQENLAINFVAEDISELKKFANKNWDCYTLRTDEGADFIFEKLKELAGSYVINLIDSLDLKKLVMRKKDNSDKLQIPFILSPLEEDVVETLHSEGYLSISVDDKSAETIKITDKGAAYLFMINNKDKIKGLKVELRAFGLNEYLLEEYFTNKKINGKLEIWDPYESVRYREFMLWYEAIRGETRK